MANHILYLQASCKYLLIKDKNQQENEIYHFMKDSYMHIKKVEQIFIDKIEQLLLIQPTN